MKNQFIKNKINQPKKVEKKKKFTKEQLIVFILMIFWTISSIFVWVSPLIKSSSDNTLTAYADSVEESASTYDNTVNDSVTFDFTDTRYQNIIYLGFDESYSNSSADLSVNADGSFNFSCENNSLLGYKSILTTNSYTLIANYVDVFFNTIAERTTSSGSKVPLYFYMYLENNITPNYTPLFGLNFISSAGNFFMSPLQSGIAYNISNYVSEDILQNLTRIDLEMYVPSGATLDFFCLPVMYLGTTATAVRSYSPLYYFDNGFNDGYSVGKNLGYNDGYQFGYNDGLDDGYNDGFINALEFLGKSFLLDLDYSARLFFEDGTEFLLSNLVKDYEIPLIIDYKNNSISFNEFFSTGLANQVGLTRIDIFLNFTSELNFRDYSFLVDFGNPFITLTSRVFRYPNNDIYILKNNSLNEYGLTSNSLSVQNTSYQDIINFYTIIFEFRNETLEEKDNFTFTITDKSTLDTIIHAHNVGYNQARNDLLGKETYTFTDLITAVVDAPIQALTSLLNFNLPILNINMYNLATSLITLAVLVFILRLIL